MYLTSLLTCLLAAAGIGKQVRRSNGFGPYTKSDLLVHPGSVANLTDGNRMRHNGNRWMPHAGEKQRARHAGKPDGLMHTPTATLRSNDFKRAQEAQPAPAKPKRTRAKKVAAA